jgi:iron complex transport system substrate-binding protein
MRTISLLPAATEMVAALGMIDHLVGVSHECNYPEEVNDKPRVTACEIYGNHLPSNEIDRWVNEKLAAGADLFTLDEPLLRDLKPELILTQRLCDVCAPAYGSVTALAETLPGPPRVLNLEPSNLADILANIQSVADALGVPDHGRSVIAALQQRIRRVRDAVADVTQRPRVAVIEWLDPVFCSGHWTPELVELAGGDEVLGLKGEYSVAKTWADVVAARPEILILASCGQTAERAVSDWRMARAKHPEIDTIPAVAQGQVYAADGNAYFSRPGPRVVDALEIVAKCLWPERFEGWFPRRGVIAVQG